MSKAVASHDPQSTSFSDLMEIEVERVDVPQLRTKSGNPVVFWLQHLPAGSVIDAQNIDSSVPEADRDSVRQDRMFSMIPQAVVKSPTDRSLAFPGVSVSDLKSLMPAVAFSAIVSKMTEMAGWSAPKDGTEGVVKNESSASDEIRTSDSSTDSQSS